MSQSDHGEPWLLYVGMIQTVLDGHQTDTLPHSLCHCHCLQEIDFVDIFLFSIILLNSAEAKLALIVSLEAVDDLWIKRLDV